MPGEVKIVVATIPSHISEGPPQKREKEKNLGTYQTSNTTDDMTKSLILQ